MGLFRKYCIMKHGGTPRPMVSRFLAFNADSGFLVMNVDTNRLVRRIIEV